MKLEGERWRTLVSTVRLGKDEYRVVRPARSVAHAPLYEGYRGVESCVDKAAARVLALAWMFAMRSPRTLVYLPLRRSGHAGCVHGDGPMLDLVLMHHSLGFRLSRWKEVRARLGDGRLHTAVSRGLGAERDHEGLFHRENRDLLRGEVVGETAFVVGSGPAFHVSGFGLCRLAEDGPRFLHENPGAHCCAEITEGVRNWMWMHVFYCDE
ncbi:hypothetical protein, partial [Lentzea sp. NPDC060358]|uniref:hypothetical protein n=1 Tax=Lentzea sp. NPDC060358 TaxID=3347103 RepID=UPI00364F2DE6